LKRLSRVLTAFLAIALLAGSISSIWGTEPAGIDLQGEAGAELRFSLDDFTPCLNNSSPLRGIVIVDLPQSGLLTFGGRPILPGEAVTAETLESICFIPQSSENIETGFSFLPVYVSDALAQPVLVNISLVASENKPPQAQDVEVKTYKNILITGKFSANDPEGGGVTYRIVSKPKRGKIELLPKGGFSYTPFPDKTGKDSISYIAIDDRGNTSQEAQIYIRIEKPPSKTTYSDMEGHPAHYAALRLKAEGIFSGQTVCGINYFEPDSIVSRAEMITMVLRAADLDDEITPVYVTGFYDDAFIPAWFKPYARLGAEKGIVKGTDTPEGHKRIDPESPISLAQAVELIDNAINPPDVIDTFRQNSTSPEWVSQAAANISAAGILTADNDTDWEQSVTRAQGAEMLIKAMDFQGKVKGKSGLLSWVFGW